MRKNLFLLCGVPGSGKSTFVKSYKARTSVWVSRDKIRFSLLEDGDEYFSKEDIVFDVFINTINEAILDPKVNCIYVDATHLNERSRNKTLDKLFLDEVDVTPICFNLSLFTCLERNENRKNNPRAYVPRGVIRRMYNTYEKPTHLEKHKYKEILTITD